MWEPRLWAASPVPAAGEAREAGPHASLLSSKLRSALRVPCRTAPSQARLVEVAGRGGFLRGNLALVSTVLAGAPPPRVEGRSRLCHSLSRGPVSPPPLGLSPHMEHIRSSKGGTGVHLQKRLSLCDAASFCEAAAPVMNSEVLKGHLPLWPLTTPRVHNTPPTHTHQPGLTGSPSSSLSILSLT